MACEAEHMYMYNAHVRDEYVQFKPKVNTLGHLKWHAFSMHSLR